MRLSYVYKSGKEPIVSGKDLGCRAPGGIPLTRYGGKPTTQCSPRNLLQNHETDSSLRLPIWFSELEVL